MPTYEYICTSCNEKLEVLQKITDDALTDCPKCQGNLKRGFGGGVGFSFQGSGFYITDYATPKNDTCCPCSKTEGGCSPTN